MIGILLGKITLFMLHATYVDPADINSSYPSETHLTGTDYNYQGTLVQDVVLIGHSI